MVDMLLNIKEDNSGKNDLLEKFNFGGVARSRTPLHPIHKLFTTHLLSFIAMSGTSLNITKSCLNRVNLRLSIH